MTIIDGQSHRHVVDFVERKAPWVIRSFKLYLTSLITICVTRLNYSNVTADDLRGKSLREPGLFDRLGSSRLFNDIRMRVSK